MKWIIFADWMETLQSPIKRMPNITSAYSEKKNVIIL